jgi:hypothetical protein
VLLGTAALSDPSNSVLQYACITASELLLCCLLPTGLGSRHAAALHTGASSPRASSSSSRNVSNDKGGSSSSNSQGTDSSSSAVQWAPGEVNMAVVTVLQCWCRLMQQQLQLALKQTALPDTAPAGNSNHAARVIRGATFYTSRLNTITLLLPVLADASVASTSL